MFRAEDTALKRLVALKVMLPQYAANPADKARFLREARAQAQVEHEHVITVYHADEDRELHACLNCGSHLVYPVQWEEAGSRTWQVTLRCPECEWTEGGVFTQDQCDRFDDELESGTDALTRDYKRLITANMSEEIDRFATALHADAILPSDF